MVRYTDKIIQYKSFAINTPNERITIMLTLEKDTIGFCRMLLCLTLFLSKRIGVEKKGSLVNEQVLVKKQKKSD